MLMEEIYSNYKELYTLSYATMWGWGGHNLEKLKEHLKALQQREDNKLGTPLGKMGSFSTYYADDEDKEKCHRLCYGLNLNNPMIKDYRDFLLPKLEEQNKNVSCEMAKQRSLCGLFSGRSTEETIMQMES